MFERPGANQPSSLGPLGSSGVPAGFPTSPGAPAGALTGATNAVGASLSDCNQTLADMYTYIDGELPPSFDQVVRSHLDGCTDCLGAFSFHVELRELVMRKAATERMPPGLAERIRRCFGD
jgi:mycothiol system anti-sigma-R factor